MARIWANRLEAGTQLWENCPAHRREAVKKIMQDDIKTGRGGMTAERYEEITGEPYMA